MQSLPILRSLVLGLFVGFASACSEAFQAHPTQVARVDERVLTVDRLADLIVTAQPLPLETDVVADLALHWVQVIALARRAAQGDSLIDSARVQTALWLPIRQQRVAALLARVRSESEARSPLATDSAYRAGNLRVVAHVFRRAPVDTVAEVRRAQRNEAQRILDRLLAGGTWDQAVAESQDEATRSQNGLLGGIKRGDTPARFENAAFALAPGDVSSVVETPGGFHIIYRPTLEDVRTQYAGLVAAELTRRRDSAYTENLFRTKAVVFDAEVAETIRRVVRDPARWENSDRSIVHYGNGGLTAASLVQHVRFLSPRTQAEIAAASDRDVMAFARNLVLTQLLLEQADSAGVMLPDSTWIALVTEFRSALESVWENTGLFPDSLLGMGVAAEREREAMNRVDRYLDNAVARRVPLELLPPFLAAALLDGVDWEVNRDGIERAIDIAARLLAAAGATAGS